MPKEGRNAAAKAADPLCSCCTGPLAVQLQQEAARSMRLETGLRAAAWGRDQNKRTDRQQPGAVTAVPSTLSRPGLKEHRETQNSEGTQARSLYPRFMSAPLKL